MNILNLNICNFRNYSNTTFDFSQNNNIIYGFNGEGKTNLLESLYFLSLSKSFKNSKNSELIKFNESNFFIECNLVKKNRNYNIKINYDISNKYDISINGVKYKSKNSILGLVKVVLFCPDDLYLVKDSPEVRRRFLNDTLIQFRPKYLKLLNDYNKYLKNKNYILKHLDEKPSLLDLLTDYNFKLAELSAEISFIRANFLKLLCNESSKIYSEIAQNEYFNLKYITKLSDPSFSIDQNKYEYEKLLNMYKNKEISSRNCLIGIHKDDILFEINDINARSFASQGQTRSIALCLKLGVRELLIKDTSSIPILLLDDVLSELDEVRQNFILNKIKKGQIFITSPVKSYKNIEGKFINIKNGDIL